jgi:uncharacterized protein (DUF1810 family)
MSKFHPPFIHFSPHAAPKGDGTLPRWIAPRERGTWYRETFREFFDTRVEQHGYPVVSDGLSAHLTFADLPPKLDEAEHRLAIGWTAEIAAFAQDERFVAALGLLALLAQHARKIEEVPELSNAFGAIRDRVVLHAIDPNVPYWFRSVAAYQSGTGVVPPGHTGELTTESLNPPTESRSDASDSGDAPLNQEAANPPGNSLGRFVTKNKKYYSRALDELRRGFQQSDWVSFVFPQLSGFALGDKTNEYSIRDLAEARAYLEHPPLGKRLRRIVAALLALDGRDALAIFACPDNLRVRASLTLFEKAAPEDPAFALALDRYFHGRRDPLTLKLLRSDSANPGAGASGSTRQTGTK